MSRAQPQSRRRRRSAGWLARVVLAFAFSTLWFGGAKLPEAEAEGAEIGESGEADPRTGRHNRVVRRQCAASCDALGRLLAWPRPPQRLTSLVTAPPRPRWARPRAPPPGDDEDDAAIG